MDGFGQDVKPFSSVQILRGFPVLLEIVTTSTGSVQEHQSCVMKSIMIAMKWLMMVVFISSTQT